MAQAKSLDNATVKKNIEKIQTSLNEKGLDAQYVSSFDAYLNEYVPMEDCHRFYVTSFSGSVAEVLVPAKGKALLFVDGRYHDQADDEVDSSLVEVVKCTKANFIEMLEKIEELKVSKLGFEPIRTSLNDQAKLAAKAQLHGLSLEDLLDKESTNELQAITPVASEFIGASTKDKLAKVISNKGEAFFLTALDAQAWITNCRGYHLPNLSSFLASTLLAHDKAYVFVAPNVPVSDEAKALPNVSFITVSSDSLKDELMKLRDQYKLEKVSFDPNMLNVANFSLLEKVFGEGSLKEVEGGLDSFLAIKDKKDQENTIYSFDRGNKSIYNTIKWAKEKVANNEDVTEYDIYAQTSEEYKKQGALEQSFNTICGVGPNGAFIHYGDPKKDLKVKPADMILLDSGGYFGPGLATDTTRTFMASDVEPNEEYKKMYTLVLKGVLQVENSVFLDGTLGTSLDFQARKALFAHGENYGHGTGHGVGIHVHEGGAGIRGAGPLRMREGQVVSIEPGFYKTGFAGVRLENIAIVQKHPDFPGYLRFKQLTYIGYEPKLIDHNLLTSEEKTWLEAYEKECSSRGNSFR